VEFQSGGIQRGPAIVRNRAAHGATVVENDTRLGAALCLALDRASATHRLLQFLRRVPVRLVDEVLSIFVDGEFQAASVFFTPFSKMTPAITSFKSGDPFNERQLFDALSISL
jgi:hypothetical protein